MITKTQNQIISKILLNTFTLRQSIFLHFCTTNNETIKHRDNILLFLILQRNYFLTYFIIADVHVPKFSDTGSKQEYFERLEDCAAKLGLQHKMTRLKYSQIITPMITYSAFRIFSRHNIIDKCACVSRELGG